MVERSPLQRNFNFVLFSSKFSKIVYPTRVTSRLQNWLDVCLEYMLVKQIPLNICLYRQIKIYIEQDGLRSSWRFNAVSKYAIL